VVDVDEFLAEPQWRGLVTTADGRLIATIARPDEHGSRYVSTLWALEPLEQLTTEHSAYAGSTDGGDLLYTAAGALRVRSRDGADRLLAAPPGGVIGVVCRDRRVPVTEARRLWWDLMSRQAGQPGPHRFLYFPDEGHTVSRPSALQVWYETVLAFFGTHLAGINSSVVELRRRRWLRWSLHGGWPGPIGSG
jgi:dipeptidyl aminopeptidase/acylaminoacyl peptidase